MACSRQRCGWLRMQACSPRPERWLSAERRDDGDGGAGGRGRDCNVERGGRRGGQRRMGAHGGFSGALYGRSRRGGAGQGSESVGRQRRGPARSLFSSHTLAGTAAHLAVSPTGQAGSTDARWRTDDSQRLKEGGAALGRCFSTRWSSAGGCCWGVVACWTGGQDSRNRTREEKADPRRAGGLDKEARIALSLSPPLASTGLIASFLVPAILPRLRGPRASRHQRVAIAQASPANFVVRKRTYAVVDEDLPSSDPHTGCHRSLPLPSLPFPGLIRASTAIVLPLRPPA
ncbi:hypothetical protein AAT19DRAFT_11059 [Rhodotorula toruloides]|uniref:Uncharacterized protein n=1 Tax=Rhodotorula toruloides TaxID=5286 RepID=A0A2S9ZX30_RHOTO|nr:hypothetical protein AAT19DRAFT_11059 [Rhodotorula toruloides]